MSRIVTSSIAPGEPNAELLLHTINGIETSWKTPQLKATTLDGIVEVAVRLKASSQNVTVGAYFNVVDASDTISAIYAVSRSNRVIATTTETIYHIFIPLTNVLIEERGRIEIRILLASLGGSVAPDSFVQFYYNATAPNISGDAFVRFPVELALYTPPPNPFGVRQNKIIGSKFVLKNVNVGGSVRITSTKV